MKAFYTVQELAERWGVSERTVERFITNCLIEVTRFGRSVRISAAETLRFETTRRSFAV